MAWFLWNRSSWLFARYFKDWGEGRTDRLTDDLKLDDSRKSCFSDVASNLLGPTPDLITPKLRRSLKLTQLSRWSRTSKPFFRGSPYKSEPISRKSISSQQQNSRSGNHKCTYLKKVTVQQKPPTTVQGVAFQECESQRSLHSTKTPGYSSQHEFSQESSFLIMVIEVSVKSKRRTQVLNTT